MFDLNTDSINSDVIMVGNDAIEYYDEKYVSFPINEYIEEILNMVERQKKMFDKVYNEVFLFYDKNPEFIDIEYKMQIPGKATILLTNHCFYTILFLLLVSILFSIIYFSVCFRNKTKLKIVKAEPQIIKAKPLELKINKT